MKELALTVLFVISFLSAINADDRNYNLHMKMIISSPDTSLRILNNIGKPDELIEGYFLLPRYDDMRFELPVRAFLQPGGFNFLDGKVFGQPVDFLKRKWVENKFPMQDLESLTNGVDIAKIISFQITPVPADPDSDSITLFIKYAVFSLIEQKNYEFDFNYNVQLFYKKVDVQLANESSFDFIDEHFEGYEISFLFTKDEPYNRALELENSGNIIEEIVKSANESTIHDLHLNLGTELYREKNPKPLDPFDDGYLALYKEYHLPGYNVIVDAVSKTEFNLPVSLYKAQLSFPFMLYNSQKDEQYKNYETREDLFQSTCDVIIVPISMNADSLTADIFVNYKKLNLNDNFQRWTPIKKRLTINRSYSARLEMPEENWSASFTRKGEHYDIYGYSDFERYVDEWIIIRLFNL